MPGIAQALRQALLACAPQALSAADQHYGLRAHALHNSFAGIPAQTHVNASLNRAIRCDRPEMPHFEGRIDGGTINWQRIRYDMRNQDPNSSLKFARQFSRSPQSR
jgi:hypothetical protein